MVKCLPLFKIGKIGWDEMDCNWKKRGKFPSSPALLSVEKMVFMVCSSFEETTQYFPRCSRGISCRTKGVKF